MSVPVLDHGFVRLDGALADDLAVVNAARVSLGRRHEAVEEGDAELISYLLRHRHGTPFEHAVLRFHVRAPIFVAREWFRHRIGSFNELSLRYTEATDDFYVPAPEDVRSQVGKPGAYTYGPTADADAVLWRIRRTYAETYAAYEALLARGVARELARVVLPVGLYTEFYWTVNARSLLNFLSLRNAETAQLEIRRYAEVLEDVLRERMPLTHAAFVGAGRVAP